MESHEAEKKRAGKWIILAALTACAAVSLVLPGPLNLHRLIGPASTPSSVMKPKGGPASSNPTTIAAPTMAANIAEAENNMLLAALRSGPLVSYPVQGGCLVALSGAGGADDDEIDVWLSGEKRHIHLDTQPIYLQVPAEGAFDLIVRTTAEGRHPGAHVAVITANGRFVLPHLSVGSAVALPFKACAGGD